VDEYTITPTLENVVSTAGGLTLVFTHGTSFNKALWKPTIARVLRKLDGPDCHPRRKTWVKKILAIDAINHGESWEINKKFLSDVCRLLALPKQTTSANVFDSSLAGSVSGYTAGFETFWCPSAGHWDRALLRRWYSVCVPDHVNH
jgi:pimeloyl-ACP methyl ester carboxylesterase